MKLPSKLKGRPGRSLSGDAVNAVVLIAFGAFMILPMVYVVSNAFKPLDELFMYPPRFFVRNPTWDNFASLNTIFSDSYVPFGRYVYNTLFITVVATVGQVFISSMAGYVLEKKRFPGDKLLFGMIVTSLMFTATVTEIPNYLIMSRLKWIDTHWSIVVPAVGSTMGVFLMKQFMETIPDTVLEAARIDGAGENTIFWKIVMPNVKPAWLTVTIFTVQSMWGTTGGSYLYSEELKTLPYALSQIVSSGIARTGAGAAVSLLMLIVPVTVLIISQRNVLQTMMSSGIKG